jgi:NAD(P)-dependent dehydrogenase (short-subunit alcohol dehydrogenase family)
VHNNKVVIITGASSGIGLACAWEFARKGASVVLAARNIAAIEKLSDEIISEGLDAFPVKTDVSREEDCRNLIESTLKRYQRIDILINNAGLSMRALFSQVDLMVLRKVMDVNFWGTVYCTKYALPYLLESKGSVGRNIISCRIPGVARKNGVLSIKVCHARLSGGRED